MKNKNVVGHCLGGGPVIRGLVAAAALLFSVNVSATLVIDNFKDGTKVSANDGESLCAEANSILEPASAIIGTERDMSITSVIGSVTMDSFFVGLLTIEQETDANIVLQWDGVDNDGSNTGPCVLNPTGLGGEDLTQGGFASKLGLLVSSTSPADTQIDIRIYTDATHWSSYLLDVNTPDITSHVIEHNDFTPAGTSGGVDFANVGAIEMRIMTPAGWVTIYIDLIITDNDSTTFNCKSVTEIPKKECKALIALYDSTDGENWLDNEGWKMTNTPCSWYGVTCQDGHVTGLSLKDNKLKGSISKKFFKLKNLESIVLSDNDLNGTSLNNFKKLKKLKTMLVSNCKLSGKIPNSLMKLNKLNVLDLKDNCLKTEVSKKLKKWLDNLNPGWDESQTACLY
jgi:hypothetical protein